MKFIFITAAVMILAAQPALARQSEEDIDALHKTQADAEALVSRAAEASDAGDTAGSCDALSQAHLLLLSGYFSAGQLADELREEGGQSSQARDVDDLSDGFLDEAKYLSGMLEGCPAPE